MECLDSTKRCLRRCFQEVSINVSINSLLERCPRGVPKPPDLEGPGTWMESGVWSLFFHMHSSSPLDRPVSRARGAWLGGTQIHGTCKLAKPLRVGALGVVSRCLPCDYWGFVRSPEAFGQGLRWAIRRGVFHCYDWGPRSTPKYSPSQGRL